ncbi:MAG: hypothetical protein EPN93_11965 [Spirochaetes bacterium]|nr:MAG: hypothetical protein EPN93_11965 [Spirochaetota bacterium]
MLNKTTLVHILVGVAMVITAPGLFAAEKMTVAILDLTPRGVPVIVAGAVSDIMRAELSNYGNFTVVERNQMKAILAEQSFQMTGCTDEGCAIQAGKLLSARRIIAGEVTALENSILITVRYIDVEKGASLLAEKGTGASIDVIDQTATDVAKRLAQRIVGGDKEVLISKSPFFYYTLSTVPGLGQFYAGRPVKGIVFGSLGLAAGAGVYFMYANYQSKSDAYHELGTGSSEFDSRYNDYKKAGDYFNYSLIVFGAVYLAHWVDVLFFSRPDFSGGAVESAARDTFFDYQYCVNTMTPYPERVHTFSVGYRF